MEHPSDHLFIVNDAPRAMMSRELAVWLYDMGVWDHILFHDASQRNEACQYNQSTQLALETGHKKFVFVDSDIRPHVSRTAAFWEASADVVGCKYPTGRETSWDDPGVIHAGLWRTRREVLEATGPVWFRWGYNEKHTRVTSCLCKHLCSAVTAAGFTIEQAGWAMHEPRHGPQPAVAKEST